MSDTDLLFVYGTLRRGSAHAMGRWLAARADWLGVATCAPARLYRVGWYPALVTGGAPGDTVTGDLYRLHDTATLWPALDDFEAVAGRDDDEYERCLGDIRIGAHRTVRAWLYAYRRPVADLPRIAGGDWLAAEGR